MKKLISLLLLISICLMLCLVSCGYIQPSEFTEEEHIERISKRVQAKYIDGDEPLRYEERPTSFSVYPIYNMDDELAHFLVEFEPYGFLYVSMLKEPFLLLKIIAPHKSMYILSRPNGELPWNPYKFDETIEKPKDVRWEENPQYIWQYDENGEKITYNRSPYKVAGFENERLYYIELYQRYSNGGSGSRYGINAIKKDSVFINLVSMEEVIIVDGEFFGEQAWGALITSTPKAPFDL